MGDTYWDDVCPHLALLFAGTWGTPVAGMNRRQEAATLFAMRAMRRLLPIDSLFKSGFYPESLPLVRQAYEDWLYLAYLLREPGDGRVEAFIEAIYKLDARMFDAFAALHDVQTAERFFGTPTANVAAYLGLPRSQTKAPSFASLADDVGLRSVHDFAYTYLSGLSHPDGRVNHIFELSEAGSIARIPGRDAQQEMLPALWMAWFTTRIGVLANAEFGSDFEQFAEDAFMPLTVDPGWNIETSILVRELRTA